MSEPLRVALVAEGNTDAVIIEAALKATLGDLEFILTLLQPEPTRPKMGGGWAGVFKWCREFAGRGSPCLELDPTLPGFDLFLLHLDADVAGMKYEDCGASVVEAAESLLPLPCEEPCPPPFACVEPLRARLCSWLGLSQVGSRTVFCIPSKSSEAWLASAVLPKDHRLLSGIECNPNLATQLASLAKEEKISKTLVQYRARASSITNEWERVVSFCEEARRFAADVVVALDSKLTEPAGRLVEQPDAPKASEAEQLITAALPAGGGPSVQAVGDPKPVEAGEGATAETPSVLVETEATESAPSTEQDREDVTN